MKVKNVTNNTVYAEDVDVHLPFTNDPVVLDPDLLKRSRCLRSYIIMGMVEVLEYDPNERIEASIVYLHDQAVATDNIAIPEPQKEIETVNLDEVSEDIEVRIHGIFLDGGGYAKVNRNLAIKLAETGIKVKVDPKKSQNELKAKELAPIIALTRTEISRSHIAIDSIIPSFAEYSNSRYRVLYTTIESYTLPDQFIESCKLYNEIWVTSPWSKSVLEKLVKVPIYLVPAGSDPELYCEQGSRFDFKPNIKDLVFISVFGWSYRKGYDVLLKAYFEEFDASENVSLLISSRYQSGTTRFHRNKIRDDIDEIMRGFPNKDMPHVVRYNQMIPEEQMPQLYRSADCFVLPSRGEGSNLCAPEASLCGLPVIMSNVSGQQMYLREDNAYLVEMDRLIKMRPGQMHLHYWDGQKFPSMTDPKVIKKLREHMRYVFENKEEAKTKNKNLQKMIKQNYTWNHTANAAAARLRQIHAEITK